MSRDQSPINAGSMADIAFLLLIFFLVTTTMEVEQGIARNLPLRCPDCPPPQSLNQCNVLFIDLNRNDDLMVEDELTEMDELQTKIVDFYTMNVQGLVNESMPKHNLITAQLCEQELAKLSRQQNSGDYKKWQLRKKICAQSSGQQYYEINDQAVIQIQNDSKSTYGTYIAIQNEVKGVINKLRSDYCTAYGWGEYFDLKDTNPDDAEKIEMLRLLVPERILEKQN